MSSVFSTLSIYIFNKTALNLHNCVSQGAIAIVQVKAAVHIDEKCQNIVTWVPQYHCEGFDRKSFFIVNKI